jgi:dTDP-4-dehydrorhamnose reductase
MASLEAAFARHRPWAVINAAGAGHDGPVDASEVADVNIQGAVNLAKLCSRHEIPFLTFSADRVFDGSLERPYVEGDATSPACALGGSKAAAERLVLKVHRDALVVRTSRIISVEDGAERMASLGTGAFAGQSFLTAAYAPDLVRAALDLLIDEETGLWHLANQGAVPLRDFVSLFTLETSAGSTSPLIVLGSERGLLMPGLREALERHRDLLAARRQEASFALAAE